MQREHKKKQKKKCRFTKLNNNFAPASHFLVHLFCRFFYVEFPNFTFERGRKQTTTNVSFSFKNLALTSQ